MVPWTDPTAFVLWFLESWAPRVTPLSLAVCYDASQGVLLNLHSSSELPDSRCRFSGFTCSPGPAHSFASAAAFVAVAVAFVFRYLRCCSLPKRSLVVVFAFFPSARFSISGC
jgi:hypothetical protein